MKYILNLNVSAILGIGFPYCSLTTFWGNSRSRREQVAVTCLDIMTPVKKLLKTPPDLPPTSSWDPGGFWPSAATPQDFSHLKKNTKKMRSMDILSGCKVGPLPVTLSKPLLFALDWGARSDSKKTTYWQQPKWQDGKSSSKPPFWEC